MKAKGIFISALTAMAALTGCNEDENIVGRTKGNELCISTTVPALTRAPIEGTQLPEHSQIGVSLLNPDGSDYDGKAQYKNVPYKSETLANGTSWSSTNPIILSPTTGKAVAYYPYSATISDIAAIPVETASQTDYLYSDWVNDLSFDNPQANFAMNHALCAVQINLVNADYTAGPGEVTQLSVASPALATTASLNANTGALSAFAGQGDAITVDKTFTLTGESQGTKIIAIPTGIRDNLTVKVVVDGATSTVPVTVNRSFVQGKAYVVNLKVKDAKTPVELVSVTVKDWVQEVVGDFNASPTYKDSYIIQIKVPSNGAVFKSNVYKFSGTINWGDGTEVTSHSNDNNPSHTYASAGTYTITHKGTCPQLRYTNEYPYESSSIYITDIVSIGSKMGITDMSYAFFGTGLTELKQNVFQQCSEVTNFTETFRGCKNLTAIPAGLFDTCTKATNFTGTFNSSGIREIPVGLFDKCTLANDFTETFWSCESLTSIPSGLFDKLINLTNFNATFMGCKKLAAIPTGLFDKCTEVTSFYFMFTACESLQSIPDGLFDKCTKVTDFSVTFGGCQSLAQIPTGLFDKCTEVTSFMGTFVECIGLKEIPFRLFDKCPKVTNFASTFAGCASLRSTPVRLFCYCPEATNFAGTFKDCISLETIGNGAFDNSKKVTDFTETFSGCVSLTGESVYNWVGNSANSTKVHLYERKNYPNNFTKPELFKNCFSRCKKLTDYNQIPKEWGGGKQ